jgi:hypothetical protein
MAEQDNRLLRPVASDGTGGGVLPPPIPTTHRILQEDSMLILTEAGDPLRKETR